VKILCVIDHLGSGGAQRQLVALARELRGRGHEVAVFLYFPEFTFFRGALDDAGIAVHSVSKPEVGPRGVLRALRRLVASERPGAMISFLGTPNVYSVLATIGTPARPRVLVSERSSHLAERGWRSRLRGLVQRLLYGAADGVVANSGSQAEWLRRRHFWLRRKVHHVPNGLAAEAYAHTPLPTPGPALRLLAIGRVGAEKNALGLVRALRHLATRGDLLPQIAWVGPDDTSPAGLAYRAEVEAERLADPTVAAHWRWLGRRRDIQALLTEHDALIHPAFYEGYPNVVCEAFAAARPALLSAVCDHPTLAADGERGLLFDPRDERSISQAIVQFGQMPIARRQAMADGAFEFARRELAVQRLAERYEALLA